MSTICLQCCGKCVAKCKYIDLELIQQTIGYKEGKAIAEKERYYKK